MKGAEQIKGAVKSIAKKMNLKPQEVLQIFMFERLVERFKRGGSGNSNQKRLFRRTDRIYGDNRRHAGKSVFRAYMGEVQGRKYIQRRNRIC